MGQTHLHSPDVNHIVLTEREEACPIQGPVQLPHNALALSIHTAGQQIILDVLALQSVAY